MNASAINEILIQIDSLAINAYSKLKNSLNKKLIKQKQIPPPLKKALNSTLELLSIIAIIALVIGTYIASGLHAWWIKLVGQII